MPISFIIPTYNESELIAKTLYRLSSLAEPGDEIIVVDGFSKDGTRGIIENFPGVKMLSCKTGRAFQMNRGAQEAVGEYLLFLHADIKLSKSCINRLRWEIKTKEPKWGWFSLRLDSPKLVFRIIEIGANLRVKMSGIPYGDQGIFVRKDIFTEVGGYPEVPIMEDIEFAKKLKSISEGIRINTPIEASVRRFEKCGVLKTVYMMWLLRALYYLGMSPSRLVRYYKNIR